MTPVNVTLPVFNEADSLARNVRRLVSFLQDALGNVFELVIAENGSTDHSLVIADTLAKELSCVRVIHLPEPGRGRALKQAWLSSRSEVFSYMDADLSSDLTAFPAMVRAVAAREADLAVGTRLVCPDSTRRSLKRELISRVYARLVRAVFYTGFTDPQCGLKVLSREAAASLLPRVKDTEWFFDTELLVWAEHLGHRIVDVPVSWTERRDTRVKILRAAIGDIKGLCRVRRHLKEAGRQGQTAGSPRGAPAAE